MRILLAAVVYFVAVMAAGVGCGVVRTLLIAPWTGPFAAVAAEAPFMILAMVVAARWVCRRFGLETRPMRIAAGLFAFLLTMVAESSGAIWLRGQTLDAYAFPRTLHPVRGDAGASGGVGRVRGFINEAGRLFLNARPSMP
jgi:hypothetical protein